MTGMSENEQAAEADATAAQTLESWSEDHRAPTKSWYAIPNAAWLIAVLALIVVAAAGYTLGARSSSPGTGQHINLAQAQPGSMPYQAEPKSDGSYDAALFGPQAGAKLTSPEDLKLIHRRNPADPFAIGAVDAPVVMSMFSDFECPFCAKFALETEPGLVNDYVNAGLLRIEWNDLPINGPAAEKAAEAGRAAAAQGMFWQYADALFAEAASRGSGHPEFSEADLIEIAKSVGIKDIDLFSKQLRDSTWASAVADARNYGTGLGINGTPEFLIGSSHISGAQPEQNFRDQIEIELMRAAREASNN